jgi:hypothetical protein
VKFGAGSRRVWTEDAPMRTIRLTDDVPSRRLPFGSSEWAAESCLAEWSQFERDWLGPDPRRASADRRPREPLSPLAAACAGVAVGAVVMVCWSLLGTLALH